MKFCVMGAGALGGYFGGRLQAAGHEVGYVARGAHLAAMQSSGLRIESPAGDVRLAKVTATDEPGTLGPADVVFLMVKNRDVEAAVDRIRPILTPETLVMTVQNGVSAPERLAKLIGADRVLAAAVYIPADIKEPGVVRHAAMPNRLTLGAYHSSNAERAKAVAEAINATGIEASLSADIQRMLWEKFVVLSSMAGVTTLMRLDVGPIRAVPESLGLLRGAVEEAARVGRAECPTLPADIAEKTMELLTTMPANVHGSMQDDLLRGRPLELPYLSGDIVARGARHGIATPVHGMINAALMPFLDGLP